LYKLFSIVQAPVALHRPLGATCIDPDLNFSMVHELEEALEVGLADVPQDDDRVLARVRLEKKENT
jgi:hypothetical protein